jgi:cation diffusion facilitator family transporter
LLFVVKYWVGIVTGSLALITDAWHTMSDTIMSVIVLIAGRVSRKPADDDHSFGHGHAEHIAVTIIGVLLSIVAFDFILSSIEKFGTKERTVLGKLPG